MSSAQDKKNELREEVLSKRQHISESEWKKNSDSIISRFIATNFFKDSDFVHSYVSMNKRREVCTDLLLKELFESNKQVVVPITNFEDYSLTHVMLHSFGELITNKWGIREPSDKQDIVEPEKLDIIVVPMAAADRNGNRLGYGKGFYDRFLKKSPAKRVGFVFNRFLFDEIPTEEFDEKLDVIITEDEMIFP